MKGMAGGWARENGTFSVSFPRAGVGVRSSSQFLHFVLNPTTSPGSMGSSSILGWLLRAPGMGTGEHPAAALAMWELWAPLPACVPFFGAPLASALSSHPPQAEESLSLVSYLSLAPQWGFPFRSGLVLFGASRGLQHPAPTLLHVQPIPGLPGCLRPISYSLGGGQKPCTPPKCTQMQLHRGAEGHAT